MPYYHFRTIVGDMYFDKNYQVVRKPRQAKAKILTPTGEKKIEVLNSLRDKKFYRDFVELNINQSSADIASSLTEDVFVIQASAGVDDIQRCLNIMITRIREWLGYCVPELIHKVDISVIIKQLANNSIGGLIKKYKISSSMISNQSKVSEKALMELVKNAADLQELLSFEQKRLDDLALHCIPNVCAITGPALGAKLLRLAGSLERLSKMPASTIQVLGAETALFRHLRSKAKPPKHGVLHEHPLLPRLKAKDRGKASRELANKICIASKVDYFKGKPIGKQLVKDIQKRFGSWK